MRVLPMALLATSLASGQRFPCRNLNADEFANLRIHGGGSLEATPGASLRLTVTGHHLRQVPPGMPVEVDCATRWSVAPREGVEVGESTGELRVAAGVPSGKVFTVTANVEKGRRTLETRLHVYTRSANPFPGFWREKEEGGIRELIFSADGTFRLTRRPFEVYTDYWGSYRFDAAGGTLELVIQHGNFIPKDFAGKGRYRVEDRTLRLEGIYLGTWSGEPARPSGHSFVRMN